MSETFEHRALLDCAICITMCPKEFISGVGLKLYLSAGIDSAAPTIFLEKRGNWFFTAALTGLATGFDRSGVLVCCAMAFPAPKITARAIHPHFLEVISILLVSRA